MDQLLDIGELVQQNKKQEQNRLGIFESQLAICHNLIKRHNKNRIREMEYTIPTMVLGKPKFDVDVLRRYLIHHLEDNGLLIRVLDRYNIYISWKETDIDLTKFMKRKREIEKRNNNLYLVDQVAPPMDQRKIELMKFRQDRQRQLKEEREQRFAYQRARMPQQEGDFRDYVRRY